MVPFDAKYPVAVGPNVLENLDTDIVTHPLLDNQEVLVHVKYAFTFLANLPMELLVDKETLLRYSICLIPVFKQLALEKASELAQGNPQSMEMVHSFALETIACNSNDEVLAACCKIFVSSSLPIHERVETMIEQFLGTKRTRNTELLFRCFSLAQSKDPEKALNAVQPLVMSLPKEEATELLFGFCISRAIFNGRQRIY